MWTIHKQELELIDEQIINVGVYCKILSVAVQKEKICIWYIHDIDRDKGYDRKIYIHGTGHKIIDGNAVFIGTVLLMNDSLVFHVFDGGMV